MNKVDTNFDTKLQHYRLSTTEIKSDYSPPVLKNRNEDLNKRWYIEFYIWDKEKGKWNRKQHYIPSRFKTIYQRNEYARKAIKEINELLASGYREATLTEKNTNTTSKQSPKIPKFKNIEDAVNYSLDIQTSTVSEGSVAHYRSAVSKFFEFCRNNNYLKKPLEDLTPEFIQQYLNYRSINGLNNRSRNNQLNYLRSLFTHLVNEGALEYHPTEGISEKKVSSSKYTWYNRDEQKYIFNRLRKDDPEQLFIVLCLYYLFIRPKELIQLKIEHVNLDRRLVFIPAEISKNRKSETVRIPSVFIDYFKERNLNNYTLNHYLIGENGPSLKPFSKNVLGNKWRKVRKDLGLPDNKYLYSWKHTGNREGFFAGIDIKTLQYQNRHSTLEMTDIYLKELGCKSDNQVDLFPEITFD